MATIDARKQAFLDVQKSPYRLSADGRQDCNCVTKSKLLGDKLSALGIEWRYGLVEFAWTELGIPDAILAIAHDEPGVHKYVEVLIPETSTWEIVDPPGIRVFPVFLMFRCAMGLAPLGRPCRSREP